MKIGSNVFWPLFRALARQNFKPLIMKCVFRFFFYNAWSEEAALDFNRILVLVETLSECCMKLIFEDLWDLIPQYDCDKRSLSQAEAPSSSHENMRFQRFGTIVKLAAGPACECSEQTCCFGGCVPPVITICMLLARQRQIRYAPSHDDTMVQGLNFFWYRYAQGTITLEAWCRFSRLLVPTAISTHICT